MQMRILLSSLLMFGALSGCVPDYTNPNEGSPVAEGEIRLSWDELDAGKAAHDARSAIDNGQRHLLSVYGYATEVPSAAVDTNLPTLAIEDTSDFVRDKAHSAFNERAYEYARLYNLTVLEHLSD